MTYANVDRHVERFMEVLDALAEIGTIFESHVVKTTFEGENEAIESIAQTANKLRIPGFFAYHLAQEGLSLIKLIATSVYLADKGDIGSEKLKAVVSVINDAEPRLRQTIFDMEPYKSANAEEAIRIIASRMSEQKDK